MPHIITELKYLIELTAQNYYIRFKVATAWGESPPGP